MHKPATIDSTSAATPATVYVVDDDSSIRELLSWLMQTNGIPVATFSHAAAFLQAYRPGQSGCVVLDLYLPDMTGLDLQAAMIEKGIDLPVIFLSARADVPKAVAAVKHGAVDFMEKPFDYRKMVTLIKQCLQRDAVQRTTKGRAVGKHARLSLLTQREREVMDLVVAGKTNRAIGEALHISIKTVEAHRARVMDKLRVGSLAELVQLNVEQAVG